MDAGESSAVYTSGTPSHALVQAEYAAGYNEGQLTSPTKSGRAKETHRHAEYATMPYLMHASAGDQATPPSIEKE